MSQAYVPGFGHDIFVSYAHVDDVSETTGSAGWIASLIDLLEKRIAQLIGRSDAFSIWKDEQLARDAHFDAQLKKAIQETATFLIIVSPAYLASEWCTRERETFLKLVDDRLRGKSRVFVINKMMIEDAERPEEFRHLLGYQLWRQDRKGSAPRTLDRNRQSDQEAYDDVINELAWDVVKELKRQKSEATSGSAPHENMIPKEKPHIDHDPARAVSSTNDAAPASNGSSGMTTTNGAAHKTTVFLADVTDDLRPLWKKVKSHFELEGIEVVGDSWYPPDPAQFCEAVRKDMSVANLYIQLLSEFTGPEMPGTDETKVACQHRLALEQQIQIMQWRRCGLSKETLPDYCDDPKHQELLFGPTVQAVDIEDFKRNVIELLNKPIRDTKPANGKGFIFLNRTIDDRSTARELRKFLESNGFECAEALEPDEETKPEEIRQDLEGNVLDCDGLIVVYGNSGKVWVRGQLREVRKLAYRREKSLNALAVYEGPPPPKDPSDPVGYSLANMKVINCQSGLDSGELSSFLDQLC